MSEALVRLRAGFGAMLLLAPVPVLSAVCGESVDTFARRVCRLLGVRELAQAAWTHRHPARRDQLAGAVLDAAHAASMAALAELRPRRRRFALRNALAGAALALAGAAAALGRSGGPTPRPRAVPYRQHS